MTSYVIQTPNDDQDAYLTCYYGVPTDPLNSQTCYYGIDGSLKNDITGIDPCAQNSETRLTDTTGCNTLCRAIDIDAKPLTNASALRCNALNGSPNCSLECVYANNKTCDYSAEDGTASS